MPFKALTPEARFLPAGRVILWGRPNTRKTTSIVETWPETDEPGSKQFISLPGEKGWESVPHRSSIVSHVWQVEDLGTLSPDVAVREANEIAIQVAAGKFGKPLTLAVEGLHKLYEYAYDAALADLMAGDPKDNGPEVHRGPAYGVAHKTVLRFLNKLSASGVPYLVVTCWEGDTKDDLKSKDRNAPTHKAPELPGRLADAITGEFGVSVRAFLKKAPDGVKGLWQIQPDPTAHGCAIKAGLEIAKGLPRIIPQDFRVLHDLVAGVPLAEVRERYGYTASPPNTGGK